MRGTDCLVYLIAVFARHMEIAEDQAVVTGQRLCNSFRAVHGDVDIMSLIAKELAQEISHDTGVIYDENTSHGMSPFERGIY